MMPAAAEIFRTPHLVSGNSSDDDDTTPGESVFESLPALLARAASRSEPHWLIDGLIPGDGSVLLHGQPREGKSLMALGALIAVTTGTPAFGLERLQVKNAAPALYVTEEDGWYRVAQRFDALLTGAGITRPPALLHVAAGKGVSLDDPKHQSGIIGAVQREGHRLVVFDPLRSLTESADQGPRELRPFAQFLRRLIRETDCVPLIVHHDQKPQPGVPDNRRRAQRASGGGIFSIADSPIGIDRVDESRRMLIPCAYKFSADPSPVIVRLEQGPGWMRLQAEESTSPEAGTAAIDRKILDFLEHTPYSFGSRVATGIRSRKDEVLRRLDQLESAGLVDSVIESKGTKWFRVKQP